MNISGHYNKRTPYLTFEQNGVVINTQKLNAKDAFDLAIDLIQAAGFLVRVFSMDHEIEGSDEAIRFAEQELRKLL